MAFAAPNPPETFSPLFQFADADLIIRSADNVKFQVHKNLMRIASRVFRDMLTLDDISTAPAALQPVVDVKESGNWVDAMLRYIYPLPRPSIKDLRAIKPLLIIADKYDIPNIFTAVEDHLLLAPIAESYPVETYLLAKRYGL
ncbi:hypothetical protein SISNIDRAFT_418943, partial [Sistotremastrum niveocremeum HHB9708]